MRRSAARLPVPARLLPVAIALGAALLLALLAAPATAHEGRKVGRYTYVVGFGDEPAYAGAKNSVQVMVSDAQGRPVTDIGDDLAVMVSSGGKEMELRLEPYFEVGEWGIPGDYRAFFIPTAPGRFSFHLHGTVNGQKVDQRFTSGPRSFGDVGDPAEVSFPVKDPSTGQLADRLDRAVPRLNASVQASAQAARVTERRTRRAADQARLLAAGGLALGAAGLLAGGLALTRARRPAPTARHEVAVGAGEL